MVKLSLPFFSESCYLFPSINGGVAMLKQSAGFTLIELIVTFVVAALVVTIAVPSFQSIIRANRLTANANSFVTTIQFARSEAVKRSTRVTLCKSADGATCTTSGGWQQGAIVFVDDVTENATVDAGETVLRVVDDLDGGLSLLGNANVSNYISFLGSGFPRLTSGGLQVGSLAVCVDLDNDGDIDADDFEDPAKVVVLAQTGRTRVQHASDSTTLTTCTP
ncbi:MAG: GspH/FimT family pseudopilin [Candidatus Competibacteraceae bacterium]